MMARIVLAEDHALVRQGLRMLLTTGLALEVVGETGDGAAVEKLVDDLNPDLLILDLELPGCHGVELVGRIRARQRAAPLRILIVTGNVSAEMLACALAAGADGYVLKHEDGGELLQAVRIVLAGKRYVSAAIVGQGGEGSSAGQAAAVTARERQIISLIARGLANQDIADALRISPHTVRTHRKTLMAKLNLRNAAEITTYAVRHGLHDPT